MQAQAQEGYHIPQQVTTPNGWVWTVLATVIGQQFSHLSLLLIQQSWQEAHTYLLGLQSQMQWDNYSNYLLPDTAPSHPTWLNSFVEQALAYIEAALQEA